jgi:hypothetical protein
MSQDSTRRSSAIHIRRATRNRPPRSHKSRRWVRRGALSRRLNQNRTQRGGSVRSNQSIHSRDTVVACELDGPAGGWKSKRSGYSSRRVHKPTAVACAVTMQDAGINRPANELFFPKPPYTWPRESKPIVGIVQPNKKLLLCNATRRTS